MTGARTTPSGRVVLPALAYRDLLVALSRARAPFADRARAYAVVPWRQVAPRRPFEHQMEALEGWRKAGHRGIVVLPTGAGKTHVAILAIEEVGRSALVVVPTLALLEQWCTALGSAFDVPVGRIGGGAHRVEDLTVTTYASASRRAGELGNRFGLVVFDECHHLPGGVHARAGSGSIAPYRLGLTATPERGDSGEADLQVLIGPIVCRREVGEMVGEVLSDYEVITIEVGLGQEERRDYEEAREIYLGYLRQRGLRLGSAGGFQRFLRQASRSRDGRLALAAYRRQKRLAETARGKEVALEEILRRHAGERSLIFTASNASAYRISQVFLVPALTHQTRPAERRQLLDDFSEGRLPTLVTSRVLNEGIDIAEASVAVVLSGSGSVREHVQRLGRILRRSGQKRATLYEVVAADTAERAVWARRRKHVAFGS